MVAVTENTGISRSLAAARSFLGSVFTPPSNSKSESSEALRNSEIDLLAMPALVRKSVASLNPYSPSHIGPLIAKEFVLESKSLRMNTKAEVFFSVGVGLVGTSIVMNAASTSFFSLAGLLVSSAIASAAGAGMWLYRKQNGASQERLAKLFGKTNYALRPEYESLDEALAATRTEPRGSSNQLIALRHALTHVPLFYGSEASSLAGEILRHAETSFRGSLVHIDATMGLLHAAHATMSREELLLLSENLLSLTAKQRDPLGRIESAYFPTDQDERLVELRAAAEDFSVTLFRMKFADPRMKCDALSLARSLLERPLGPRAQDSVLDALRENCIEAFLGYIPSIPSPADKLIYLKEAAKFRGLEKDQKHLIASLIKGISAAKQFTAGEAAEAKDILSALSSAEKSVGVPTARRREAA